MNKTIAVISPYHGESHSQWYNNFQRLDNDIQLYSLEPRFWKWRMQAAAITLAQKVNFNENKIRLFVCNDMLNLALFKALLKPSLQNIPILLYMHENQLTYPWSPLDLEKAKDRDQSYCFINYTSTLLASKVLFNSKFHFKEYFNRLPIFLKQFPDHSLTTTVVDIKQKSSVLYPIVSSSISKNPDNKIPVILWNHRWEHDKQPKVFYELLFYLRKNNIDFRLILLGKNKENQYYRKITQQFNSQIIHHGFVENKESYFQLLNKADVLPVSSIHDFFGYSILEASMLEVIPILPNRLSYPELFSKVTFRPLFYETQLEFFELTASILSDITSRETLLLKQALRSNSQRFSTVSLNEHYQKLLNCN